MKSGNGQGPLVMVNVLNFGNFSSYADNFAAWDITATPFQCILLSSIFTPDRNDHR